MPKSTTRATLAKPRGLRLTNRCIRDEVRRLRAQARDWPRLDAAIEDHNLRIFALRNELDKDGINTQRLDLLE